MELRCQNKEIEMPKTSLGYNYPPNRNSPSPKLSSSAVGERSDQQKSSTATTVFTSNPPHSSEHHNHLHHHHSLQSQSVQQQSQRTRSDPDPSSSDPVATTTLTNTSVVTFTAQTTTATSAFSIRYRECLRNHAANMGCHVVDGCGEFMPCGEDGTPESLRCAACDCHRNFHRKEGRGVSGHYSFYPNNSNGQNRILSHPHRFSHGLVITSAAPVTMAFRGGPAESSSEGLDVLNDGGQISMQPSLSKKRFRTRFTQQQKDRMMEFAEQLGWKIQKHDEQEVQQFCSQVGVKRQVFKVWMHNNKQTMKKQQMQG